MDDGDVVQRTEIEDGYRKLAERTKTVPSHYSPQAPALSSLVETWPSFPTNVTGYSAGILKTLLWLSDRTPNGYVPPYELGSRLFNGRYVYFLDQEENNQASMEAMKLSQQSADKNSQRKGGLVEPKEVHFEPINTESRNALLQSFVQGSYPKNDHVGKPALVVDAMKNLKNNETYVTAGKSLQFISKLESLLASNRPVKSV
ncbi:hypothetical protein EYZ11_007407 [Aspergillus tanneri]|nr:hypothetical protein EYZ11_007407 [Aspergillus tanneri]